MIDHGEAVAVSGRVRLAIIVAIASLSACVRLFDLGSTSLWYDEAISARSLTFSDESIIARKTGPGSVHPPLYFLALKHWSTIAGDSEVALRSLASLFGIATVLGTFIATRDLAATSSRLAPLSFIIASSAALLIALSPLQVVNSRQVRGYSLAAALTAFSSWMLVKALYGTGRTMRAAWMGWAVLSVCECLTSHLGVLTVVGQISFAAAVMIREVRLGQGPETNVQSSQKATWAACAVTAVALAYAVPWGSQLVSQASTVQTTSVNRSDFRWNNLPRQIYRTMVASWYTDGRVSPALQWILVTSLVASIGILALRESVIAWYVLATGAGPVACLVIFSLFSNRDIAMPRYMSLAHIALVQGFVISLFVGVQSVWAILPRTVVSCGLGVAMFSNSGPDIYPIAQPGMRRAAEFLAKQCGPNDMVLAERTATFFGLSYYLRREVRPLLLVGHKDLATLRGGHDLNLDDLLSAGELSARQSGEVWVASSDSYSAVDVVRWRIPDNWTLLTRRVFAQDRFWERPIVLQQFHIESP